MWKLSDILWGSVNVAALSTSWNSREIDPGRLAASAPWGAADLSGTCPVVVRLSAGRSLSCRRSNLGLLLKSVCYEWNSHMLNGNILLQKQTLNCYWHNSLNFLKGVRGKHLYGLKSAAHRRVTYMSTWHPSVGDVTWLEHIHSSQHRNELTTVTPVWIQVKTGRLFMFVRKNRGK